MEKEELIKALVHILSACSYQCYKELFFKSSLRDMVRNIQKIAKAAGLKFSKEDCVKVLMGQYELTEAFAREALGLNKRD